MSAEAGRAIRPTVELEHSVHLPPSKSYTNRAYIAAALASGSSVIHNRSQSDDSEYLLSALREFGIPVKTGNEPLRIEGSDGALKVPDNEIFVGNAGTAMRFLTSFASLAPGTVRMTGDEQMLRRPVQDLLDSLKIAGIHTSSENGFPPIVVRGGSLGGGSINMNGTVSSQFLSSMLLYAPYAKHPTTLRVKGELRSRPYIDMTLHVMRSFGAMVDVAEPNIFTVSNRDRYIGREFSIEGDATSATYFAAAAAITKGKVYIENISRESVQGDVAFFSILEEMGCSISERDDGIEIVGGSLSGIELDMNNLPDCVPTLAVVALFASGPTTITNVGHLRHKESNRLVAIAAELKKLGAGVELFDEGVTIRPGKLSGATIETYNDHRMAMSFAIAGLAIPGVRIINPDCVSKSYPEFWSEFEKLEGKA